MKKIFFYFVVCCLFFFSNITYSQEDRSPYPIIFVHGLNSDNGTWNTTINQLATIFRKNNNNVFQAVLNATTSTKLEDDILTYFNNCSNQLSDGDLFAINFKNFWNQNSGNPQININSSSTPDNNQSKSNQSAIYKQGYAVKKAIESILNATGAEKVILVGHSMGGLAIREYLQRVENGKHKWWYNPNDEVNGHKVAKVVTIGTPHRGSNAWATVAELIGTGIDDESEAVRDLKTSYIDGTQGVYLYGGDESYISTLPIIGYYNNDVNCDEIMSNNIVGLNQLTISTNIDYNWIVSNFTNSGDGVVLISSQYLSSPGDTLMTNKFHSSEPSDFYSIIRGLDEPDLPNLAYSLKIGTLYKGLATIQSNNGNIDNDWYKINFDGGLLSILFTPSGVGGGRIDFFTASPTSNSDSQLFMNFSGSQPIEFIPSLSLLSGEYYIRIQHENVNENDWRDLYYLSINNLGKGIPNISKLEYFADSDPGLGNGINVPVTIENNISKTFEISLLNNSLGIHTLGLRAQDQFGNWSHTFTRPFLKDRLVSDPLQEISDIEFFVDNDPGFGRAKKINFSAGTTIDINHLISPESETNGIHTLSMRARNSNGDWGLNYIRPFLKEDDLSNITNISYSFIKGVTETPEYRYNNFISQADVDLNFSASLPNLQLNTNYLLKISAQDSYLKKSAEFYHSFLVTANSNIVLTSPNGGESWKVGIVHNITWSSTSVENVKIEYSTNQGNGWILIMASVPANTNSFAWTIPNTLSANNMVRISNTLDPNEFDVSDATFSIVNVTPPSPPILVYPVNNANLGDDLTPDLSWNTVLDANYFHAQVSHDSTFKNSITENSNIQTLNWSPGLSKYGKYFWRVKAHSIENVWSNWSDTWNFKISIPSPKLFQPLNGAVDQDTSVLLKWNKASSPSIFWLQFSSDSNFVKPAINDSSIVDTIKIVKNLGYNSKYHWRVKTRNSAGDSEWSLSWRFITKLPTSVEVFDGKLPEAYKLFQNNPNPFNPSTTIKFSIPNSQFITLKVYDILGREVATLVNEEKIPGNYEVKFNGSNLSSGVYFYKLQSGSFSDTKKFILMK